MQNKNNYLVRKILSNNFYLGKVKFEDGYDKRIGTDFKIRPILILNSFFDHKDKKRKYIIVPVYRCKKNEIIKQEFRSKYKNHTSISIWYDFVKKDKKKILYTKFKINQIQILEKKDFVYKIENNTYKYFLIKNNSPVKENDLNNLLKQIKLSAMDKNKNDNLTKTLLLLENLRLLNYKKEKQNFKNYEKNYSNALYNLGEN